MGSFDVSFLFISGLVRSYHSLVCLRKSLRDVGVAAAVVAAAALGIPGTGISKILNVGAE